MNYPLQVALNLYMYLLVVPYNLFDTPFHVMITWGSSRVPQKVRDRIWAREYVESSTLLQQEDQKMKLQISSDLAKPTCNLVPKNKKEVNTIVRWIKAFNCFMVAYSWQCTEEVPDPLKHMEVVIGLADNNTNFRSYIKSFRKLLAKGWRSWIKSILTHSSINHNVPGEDISPG